MEGDQTGNESRGEGGLLDATREPLWQALSAGFSAAALILAIVFLASAGVRHELDSAAVGLAFAAFAVVAVLAPKWIAAGWLQRTRGVALVVSLSAAGVVAARWLIALMPIGSTGMPSDARDVLLVTFDRTYDVEREPPPSPGWTSFAAVNGSTRKHPALATLLTGLEVIEHRVLFDQDALPSRALTLAEILESRGYKTAILGGMWFPRWAHRGYAEEGLQPTVRNGLEWLGGDALQFAHVHMPRCNAVELDAQTQSFRAAGGIVIACGGILWDSSEAPVLWWGEEGAERPAASPRSLASVLPSLLARIGAEPAAYADAPLLFGDQSEAPAVTMTHGETDEVHRLQAVTLASTVSIELTPLGRHATDDWTLAPEIQEHFVYRNDVRFEGAAANDASLAARFLKDLRVWRTKNATFEAVP